MKSHPVGWLFIWHIKERLELIAVVNEAPVALQSRDLSEAAAECSNLRDTPQGSLFCYSARPGEEPSPEQARRRVLESPRAAYFSTYHNIAIACNTLPRITNRWKTEWNQRRLLPMP